MVLYGSSVRLVDARWAKDRRVVVSRHRARPRRSRGWSPRVPAFARARRRGVDNAFFFFISCVFSRRVASTRRGRETSPRDIPIESNFSEVSFGEVSVDVRLGRRLDCLARGRLRGEGERARRFVRVWSAMTTETTVKRVAGGAHAPSLDPAVARAFSPRSCP